MTETRTYWHVADPSWQPGTDLRSRNDLIAAGAEVPWLWDEADEGTDCDRVSLFRDDDEGREYLGWLSDDRPGYWVLRVDLPEDVEVGKAEWEPMVATVERVPAGCITVVRTAQ